MRVRSFGSFGAFLVLLIAVGAAAQAPAPPSAAPAPAPAAPVDQLMSEDEAALPGAYSYDAAGRRDPFRSLLIGRVEDAGTGLQGILIEELHLQGIWQTRSGFVAQMQGPNNQAWLVRKGDQLMDGEVLDVTSNEIIFRQQVNDPTRLKPFREIVKELVTKKK